MSIWKMVLFVALVAIPNSQAFKGCKIPPGEGPKDMKKDPTSVGERFRSIPQKISDKP